MNATSLTILGSAQGIFQIFFLLHVLCYNFHMKNKREEHPRMGHALSWYGPVRYSVKNRRLLLQITLLSQKTIYTVKYLLVFSFTEQIISYNNEKVPHYQTIRQHTFAQYYLFFMHKKTRKHPKTTTPGRIIACTKPPLVFARTRPSNI